MRINFISIVSPYSPYVGIVDDYEGNTTDIKRGVMETRYGLSSVSLKFLLGYELHHREV